jgi:hypothetical protein
MYVIKCDFIADGISVNPVLPKDFYSTCNNSRPKSHRKFFNLPYIEMNDILRSDGSGGVGFDVWCLDGGCWDRPTWKGSFSTLNDAVSFIKENYKNSPLLEISKN